QEWKQAEDTNTYAVRDFAYDKRGLLSKESIPYFAATSTPATGSSFAVESFEGYSAGALDGDNGGSGWTGSYGAGSLVCEPDLVVDTSSVIDGANTLKVNVDLDADDTCERELASYITGTQSFRFKMR